jgi:hypothetical protein
VYQVPDLTITANAEYQRPLTPTWAAFGRIDYSYIGGSVSGNNGELHPVRRPAYEITNLRLGVRSDRYEFPAFVKNLTNDHANLGDAILLGAELNGQPRFLINQPRTIGVEAPIRFL